MYGAEKTGFQLLLQRYDFFPRSKLLQSDQFIRSEIPSSSCIDIPLTLSSTALREQKNRRIGELEKAHLRLILLRYVRCQAKLF